MATTWTVEFTPSARREFRGFDSLVQARITKYLEERVLLADDPRMLGKALGGAMSGLWRYRVGDYRLVCQIQDDRMIGVVVKVAHRREVCRRRH